MFGWQGVAIMRWEDWVQRRGLRGLRHSIGLLQAGGDLPFERHGVRTGDAFRESEPSGQPTFIRRDAPSTFRGSGRGTTAIRSRFVGVRTRRTTSAVFALALLALSTFAIAPAAAQASGSWTLDCKGNSSGGVSWNWRLNGVPISGAGGSVGCSGTMSATGISARPSDANGFVATVYASAAADAHTNTVTKTFDTASSFQVNLSTSANGWGTFCVERHCDTFHVKEDVHFSFQG